MVKTIAIYVELFLDFVCQKFSKSTNVANLVSSCTRRMMTEILTLFVRNGYTVKKAARCFTALSEVKASATINRKPA